MKNLAVAAAIALASAAAHANAPAAPLSEAAGVTELVITDTKVGTGKAVEKGKAVSVHYTLWLYDPNAPEKKGRKVDSSRDRGIPLGFIIGVGRVIKGWEEGVVGMQEGGRRTLVIPPSLGYGAQGMGGAVPPNATLLADLELIKILN